MIVLPVLSLQKSLPVLKDLWICADDFAQNDAISLGILKLADSMRLNAISAMANSAFWPQHAKELRTLNPNIKIGLHFNLTYGYYLTNGKKLPQLSRLVFLLFTQQIKQEDLFSELVAQWESFTALLGREPDFIDGHQHVHQLYNVRPQLLRLCKEKNYQGFCRTTTNGLKDYLVWQSGFPKPVAMQLLGWLKLRKELSKNNINTNTSFLGFYPYRSAANYRDYFRSFLAKSKPGGLIMCHPGLDSQDSTDPIHLSRAHEYAYFASKEYLQDIQEYLDNEKK